METLYFTSIGDDTFNIHIIELASGLYVKFKLHDQGPVSQTGLRLGVSLVQTNLKTRLCCVSQKGGNLIGTKFAFKSKPANE